MNRVEFGRIGLVVVLLVGCVANIGCNSGSSASSQARRQQTSRLRLVVGMFVSSQQALGRPPRDEAEFKQYINQNGSRVLEHAGVSSADELLVSERDGKPLVVLYQPTPQQKATGVIAYEAEGVDGRRDVGFQLGNIQSMTDAEFAELGL